MRTPQKNPVAIRESENKMEYQKEAVKISSNNRFITIMGETKRIGSPIHWLAICQIASQRKTAHGFIFD